MLVLEGEVYLCGHDAREIRPLPYPAFWVGTDIPFDEDNLWGPPAPEPDPEPEVEEEPDDDEEEEDDDPEPA